MNGVGWLVQLGSNLADPIGNELHWLNLCRKLTRWWSVMYISLGCQPDIFVVVFSPYLYSHCPYSTTHFSVCNNPFWYIIEYRKILCMQPCLTCTVILIRAWKHLWTETEEAVEVSSDRYGRFFSSIVYHSRTLHLHIEAFVTYAKLIYHCSKCMKFLSAFTEIFQFVPYWAALQGALVTTIALRVLSFLMNLMSECKRINLKLITADT